MKKLNELKAKRASLMEELRKVNTEEITPEISERVDAIEAELATLDKDIRILLTIEKDNIEQVEASEEEKEEEDERGILPSLQNYFRTGIAPAEFRGPQGGFVIPFESMRDVLTTTKVGANNIVKSISNELVVAKSPAEGLMEKLGVRKYTGLTGDFVVPSMAQVSAAFVAEETAVPDASAAPASLKLSPRRLGAYHEVTMETLNSTVPAIWQGIVQDIKDAWYRKQFNDLCTQIMADAVDASTTIAGATLAYTDLVNLQANVPYDVVSPAYLTTPKTAAFLKTTVTLSNVAGPVWEGPVMEGSIDGLPAMSSGLVPTDKLIYADFKQAAVAEWGSGLEILVNPYSLDKEGKIRVTISGLTDTGFTNYRFSSWITDVSIA